MEKTEDHLYNEWIVCWLTGDLAEAARVPNVCVAEPMALERDIRALLRPANLGGSRWLLVRRGWRMGWTTSLVAGSTTRRWSQCSTSATSILEPDTASGRWWGRSSWSPVAHLPMAATTIPFPPGIRPMPSLSARCWAGAMAGGLGCRFSRWLARCRWREFTTGPLFFRCGGWVDPGRGGRVGSGWARGAGGGANSGVWRHAIAADKLVLLTEYTGVGYVKNETNG
jgi:hypothetical protein